MAHLWDLPTEVRLEIFRQLLLTKHSKRAAPYQFAFPHTLQPAVLCVCRQFHQEAGHVLYRENVFVHIMTNYRFLGDDLHFAGLASIARGRAAHRFAHYSLRAVFAFHALPQDVGPYHFMIPAEDLELFCMLFWLLRVRRLHQITLHLTVLPPIGDLQRSIAKQESLLRPFQQLWHIARAAVDGDVDPRVVQRLKKALTEIIPPSPEARLRFVMSLEAEGNQCLQQSDYFGGAVRYSKAFATSQVPYVSNATFGHAAFGNATSFGNAASFGNATSFGNTASFGHATSFGHSTSFGNATFEPSLNIGLSPRLLSNITLAFFKLGAWNDVMESTNLVTCCGLGFDHLTMLIAHFRKAIALKQLGDSLGSQTEFQMAFMKSRSVVTQHDIERYLRVEQQNLYGWRVDDKWLELERAKFGFI